MHSIRLHTYNTRAGAGAHKKQTKLEQSQAQTTEAPPPAGPGGRFAPPHLWSGLDFVRVSQVLRAWARACVLYVCVRAEYSWYA